MWCAGIEKAGSGRRSKRSVGEDISNQLQKKMRMQDGGSAGGCPPCPPAAACDMSGLFNSSGSGPFASSGGGPISPSGCMAMSP